MIEDKVLRTIREFKMMQAGEGVLIGVSGGVDSTALLYILNSLKKDLGVKLCVAHLDHRIRGKQAELDAEFVRKLSKELKIKCFIEDFNVSSYAKRNKLNLEDAARRIRYEFLERIAAKVGADRIALGHTASDNVETFLMRLLRGAGLKGLEGIPPVRGKIVRPLIGSFRKEIEGYLRLIKVKARSDRTNLDIKYSRNRIRHELLPTLKSYNTRIEETLLRTIRAVGADSDLIERMSKEAFDRMVLLKKPDEVTVDIAKLSALETSLKAGVIRQAIEYVKKDLTDITFAHIEDIIGMLNKGRGELDLPGMYIYARKGALKFSRSKAAREGVKPFMHKLEVPGQIRTREAGFVIDAQLVDSVPRAELMKKDPYIAYIDYDKIDKPLFVRGRKDGDVFSPLGLAGSKKLQDIFVDSKIDREKRDSIPVLDDGKKIVWIVGYRISEEAKVTPKTKKVVKLSAEKL